VKAFRLLDVNQASVQEVDQPVPGQGQVLVRVAAASFCQSVRRIVD
jgi:NADPH:quinone reductase-like Zn-dependent oxidoreductase